MKIFQIIILGLFLTILLPAFSYSMEVTEDMVNKYYQDLESYMESHNVDAVLDTVSDDVTFHYDRIINGKKVHYHSTKEQYKEQAINFIPKIKKYHISVLRLDHIRPKEVTVYINVDMVYGEDAKDKNFIVNSKEILKLINNKLQLVDYFEVRENI